MTMVVTEWRLPRVLMALLIGAALGVSGAIFQSLSDFTGRQYLPFLMVMTGSCR